jgi:alkylation response protein AidB-like acyl-CoA dehydrogenase
LAGKKYIALAISEAFAGSDVSGLQTTAVRDGDYWIITGTKKYAPSFFCSKVVMDIFRWITNGTFADYFTTGCKTEVIVFPFTLLSGFFTAYSQTGFTVILIERGPGVSTKPIKTAYSSAAGTAYVIFDKVSYFYRCKSFIQQGPHKVRVPVSNTLGKIGAGMSVILSNFNHERWMVTATSIGAQRLVVEECLKLVPSSRFYVSFWFIFPSDGQHNVSSLGSH